ncbi:MAG: NADH-quinone oxidoreductase subunit NuoH [bacterium]
METIQILLIHLIKVGIVFGVLMGCIAYVVLLERKLLGHIQVRWGPYRVGWHGLLQPLADGLKLFLKEDVLPAKVDRPLYFLAPVVAMGPALLAIAVVPFGDTFSAFGLLKTPVILQIADVHAGILFILALTSLGVYGIFLAGWSSRNKYSLLGALRSSAQMISYELALGLSIVVVLMASGDLSLRQIALDQAGGFWNWWVFSPKWLVVPGILGFFLYLISAFAETNRIPFDLPEAETELVAGYHTEYSSMKFAMFFMAEYCNIITVSCVAVTLFLGAWYAPFAFLPSYGLFGPFWFGLKVFGIVFVFIWVRGTLPRFRYDQLMQFGWKVMLPLAIINVFLAGGCILLYEMWSKS